MANETISWTAQLNDRLTGVAGKITTSLDAMEKSLKNADKSLKEVEASGRRVSHVLSAIGVGIVFDLASGLADAAWQAGKFVVNALAFKESTLVSFEMMLGSAQKARDLYQEASMFARITPFSSQETIKGFQSILGAGYSIAETKILFQALGDAASGAGDEMGAAMSGMTNALARIHGRQFVDAMHVHELTGWSARVGVGQSTVYDSIAKVLGTDRASVMAMQESGTLSSDAFIYGFVKAMQDKMGGEVGGMMMKQSHTITGLLSNLSSAPFDFISNMETRNSRGMNAFKGFLENLSDLLNVNSAAGARFAALFDRVFNDTFGSLFEDLSGPDGAKRMEQFFLKAVDWGKQLFDTTSRFVSLLAKITPTLETIEKILDRVSQFRKEGLVAPGSFLDSYQKFNQSIVDRAKQGIISGHNPIDANAGGIEDSTIGQSLDAVDFQSRALADSVSNAGVVFKDIGEKVNAPARGTSIGALHVHVDASNAGDPAGVLEAIRDQLPAELERLFDRLALETGRAS